MIKLAPDLRESRLSKKDTQDGQLGFPMPQMAQNVVAQLLDTGKTISSVPGIDPRYAHKTR